MPGLEDLKGASGPGSIEVGQTKDIPKYATRLEVGLRWDSGDKPSFDLDSSVLLYKNGKKLKDWDGKDTPDTEVVDYVSYSKTELQRNGKLAIQHQGDATSGGGDGEADNEAIRFWLDRLDKDDVLFVVVTVYSGGKTFQDLDNVDVRFRTFKDPEEKCGGFGKLASPDFCQKKLTFPSLPCGAGCGKCVALPMTQCGKFTGCIDQNLNCFKKMGFCKLPSSFFKSPFPTPPKTNTGLVALKLFYKDGSWKLHGHNEYFSAEGIEGKEYKAYKDLIPETMEMI
jgi:stress response protein SCP2